MDPPHVTEFASERYFEKLNQLRQPANGGPASSASEGNSSTFILPLRDAHGAPIRASPSKRNEKPSRRFGLRNLLHSKSSSSEPSPSPVASYSLNTAATIESVSRRRSIIPFERRFLSLPNELQVQILSILPLHDILSLRLVSKEWHALVTLHEAPITRYHLEQHIPAYALRLYPAVNAASVNLHYLCGLWHRLHVAAKLAHLMCEWTTKEIFLRTTESQRLEFAPQRERMRRRLIPLLFTIFHFFENYRRLHAQYLRDHDGNGIHRKPYTLNPIEAEIMSMYDDKTLLGVHQVFPLVIASFCRRLRPPTYVGRVERSFRGYLREKPSDEIHVAILCLGGLRQVEKLWEVKGYNARRAAVDTWYSSATKPQTETQPQAAPKIRRPFMGLGRKKSMAFGETGKKTDDSVNDTYSYAQSIAGSARANNLVFNTSLAAGMPMEQLPPDALHSMIPDLPILQQIWLTTAEALILERRVVERPQDIKRNAQVMLELIREEGFEEEDEWWYGSGGHDSVRPPAEASEDDPEAI